MFRSLLATLAVSATVLSSSTLLANEALPLKRVRLYQTGVGYFERTGSVGHMMVGLPVPATHLDDALKTLVVLDADGKSEVSGIEFGSSVSRTLGRALAGLPAEAEVPLTFTALLSSLKGGSVEVRVGTEVVRGRLVDVTEKSASGLERCVAFGEAGAAKQEGVDCLMHRLEGLVVVTDRGEIRRFATADVKSIRPLEPAQRARLDSALDAVLTGGAQTQRELSVVASGSKAITLGYMAEAPVWRSTYRLVLANDRSAAIQGWALLHNDTDEDWKQVTLELVNGRPDSFLFPLAAPRYARRELATPDTPLSTVPQLLDATVDEMWETVSARGSMWGDEIGDAFGAGGLGLSGIGEGGGGHGEGVGVGAVGASSLLSVGSLAGLAPAEGVESEAMFRYTISKPLDLRARGSALVPFVDEQVTVRRIAWFRDANDAARSAVHLVNGTRQTLPAGTLAVFSDGGFAGESVLQRTKPGEERIIRYGTDLDVELTIAHAAYVDQPQVLRWEDSGVTEHYLRVHDLTYELENRGGAARTVYLELDYVDNSKIVGAERLTYDTERDRALAVFEIDARAKESPHLTVSEGRSRPHPFESIDAEWLAALGRTKTLSRAQRAVLVAAVESQRRAESAARSLEAVRARKRLVFADLKRLRKDVRALPDVASSVRRLAAKMDALEQRVAELRQEERTRIVERIDATEKVRVTLRRLNETERAPVTGRARP